MKTTRDTRLTTIEWKAQEVLNDLGLLSLPIDPFEIAKAHRIAVQPKELGSGGVWGVLVKAGDEFGILYATHIANDGFVRFTVAHDLGHYFIEGHAVELFQNGSGEHREGPSWESDNKIEREADHFAACLLMPEGLFVEAASSVPPGLGGIRALAETCRTSLSATAIRFATLSEVAVAVVLSRGQYVSGSWLSEEMKALARGGWIRKGSALPLACHTRTFNADADNVRLARSSEESSSLEDWIDGAQEVELGEDVVGLGSSGTTLTILFAEQEESDEEDVLREDD